VFPIGWIDREDCLGKGTTKRTGEFSITFDDNDLRKRHINPDLELTVVIRVVKSNGWLVHEVRKSLLSNQDLKVDIEVAPSDLGGEHVVSGTVYDSRSGNLLPNLIVEVCDEDFIIDDFLGSATTDKSGHYRVSFERDDFLGILDINPDVYIIVKNQKGTVLHRSSTRKESGHITIIDAHIGEIELTRKVSDGFYRWWTFYKQEGTHISVRIRLIPNDDITNRELVLLRERWKKGIEEVWSDRFVCCSESNAKALSDCSRPMRVTFDVDWVEKNPHYTVRVRKGPAVSNMLLWDTEDSETMVAHHFGHMLGLRDEYLDPNCPSRIPVSTGTIMDDRTHPVCRQVNHFCQFVNHHAVAVPHKGLSDDTIAERPQSKTPHEQATNEQISRLLEAIIAGKTKLERGDKIMHRVGGGALRDRYEWSVEIFHNGLVKHRVRDEIKGIEVDHKISLDSSSMIRLIKKIIASGICKAQSTDCNYLPDSLVGCFILDIKGNRRSWSFIASTTQRRSQHCRMGRAIANLNRLMLRMAALAKSA
jgi:hypothetical protein